MMFNQAFDENLPRSDCDWLKKGPMTGWVAVDKKVIGVKLFSSNSPAPSSAWHSFISVHFSTFVATY